MLLIQHIVHLCQSTASVIQECSSLFNKQKLKHSYTNSTLWWDSKRPNRADEAINLKSSAAALEKTQLNANRKWGQCVYYVESWEGFFIWYLGWMCSMQPSLYIWVELEQKCRHKPGRLPGHRYTDYHPTHGHTRPHAQTCAWRGELQRMLFRSWLICREIEGGKKADKRREGGEDSI